VIHRMTLRLRMILVFCVVVTAFMMGIYTVVYSTFASGVMITRYDRMMDRSVPFIALLQYPAGKEILQHFDLRTQSFEVIDAGGRVIMKSKNLGSDDLPPIDVKNQTQTISQTIDTKLGSMREVIVPFNMQGKNTWFVLVERASGIARLEEDFRKKFVVIFASCLAITALLATWYVMRSLRPILLLTREAEELTHRISPAGLYTPTPKLPVRNPFDEVGRLATTFNVLFERVDSVVQQLQLFVSDAAHEIRTPLAILRGETQLLLAQPRSVLEYQQTLTALDGELATMGRIVEGLFTLSMADAGQLKIVRDKVYLDEILDEACGIVAPLAREKQITIGKSSPFSATRRCCGSSSSSSLKTPLSTLSRIRPFRSISTSSRINPPSQFTIREWGLRRTICPMCSSAFIAPHRRRAVNLAAEDSVLPSRKRS
jgi:signal transduction histidine kinase